jgi:methionyl-tRNA formyltransferase
LKIFIDGYGVVAHTITRKILENHKIPPSDIYINTYNTDENSSYVNFLRANRIRYTCASYKDVGFSATIKEFSPEILMSLYGRRIVPLEIIRLARFGTFNLHPSLLPQYKGCFSGPWAIINQDSHVGITIHEISEDIDAGKILLQEEIPIANDETGFSVWHKTASRFIAVFDEFFDRYLRGEIESRPMPLGGTYYSRSLPHGGIINENWKEPEIDAFIRAMHFPPFKGATLQRGDVMLEIDSFEQYRLVTSR